MAFSKIITLIAALGIAAAMNQKETLLKREKETRRHTEICNIEGQKENFDLTQRRIIDLTTFSIPTEEGNAEQDDEKVGTPDRCIVNFVSANVLLETEKFKQKGGFGSLYINPDQALAKWEAYMKKKKECLAKEEEVKHCKGVIDYKNIESITLIDSLNSHIAAVKNFTKEDIKAIHKKHKGIYYVTHNNENYMEIKLRGHLHYILPCFVKIQKTKIIEALEKHIATKQTEIREKERELNDLEKEMQKYKTEYDQFVKYDLRLNETLFEEIEVGTPVVDSEKTGKVTNIDNGVITVKYDQASEEDTFDINDRKSLLKLGLYKQRFMSKTYRMNYFKELFDGADIIAVQEYHLEGFKDVVEHFSGEYNVLTHTKSHKHGIHGMLMFKKDRFKLHHHLPTKHYEDGDSQSKKQIAVVAWLEDTQTQTHFITGNFHLKSGAGSGKEKQRQEEIQEMAEMIGELQKKASNGPLPILVAGDVNHRCYEKEGERELTETWKAFSRQGLGEGVLAQIAKIRGKYYKTAYKERCAGDQPDKIGVPHCIFGDDLFVTGNVTLLKFLEPLTLEEMHNDNKVLGAGMEHLKMMRPCNPTDHAVLKFTLMISNDKLQQNEKPEIIPEIGGTALCDYHNEL